MEASDARGWTTYFLYQKLGEKQLVAQSTGDLPNQKSVDSGISILTSTLGDPSAPRRLAALVITQSMIIIIQRPMLKECFQRKGNFPFLPNKGLSLARATAGRKGEKAQKNY